MEAMAPEPKRQRTEYNGPMHRLPPQPPPPPPQLHGHPSNLPPPHTYAPPQQPPPPPSPYDMGPHDPRNLPDPTGPHAYVQEHSGHNTPIREQRFHHDPNYSRRSSTSAARSPDGHHQYQAPRSMSVVTSTEGQHYPPQYSVDPTGQPAYPPHEGAPNGAVNHGLPSHSYDQAHPYPSSHPLEYAQSPVNAGPSSYGALHPYQVQYGPGASRPLKKGNRATQACDVCRARKAKCDEGRPECGYCVENDMRCNYQSVVPAKADRANQQIIDQLSSTKEDVRTLRETWGGQLSKIGGRFDKLERMLESALGGGKGTLNQTPDTKPEPVKQQSPSAGSATDAKIVSEASARPGAKDTNPDEPGLSDSFGTTGGESTGSDPLTSQTNAIYIEHDTAAQKLFRWRSIKALLRQSKELRFSDRTEEYVMDYETNKGVLRIYGKGRQMMREVSESSQSSIGAPSPAGSGPSDDTSVTSSPGASPENLWGTGFIPTATEASRVSDVGGLNPDNTLKLDPKTMTRLLKSYLDHLHIMHPFLEERGLTSLVEHFKQRYNPSESNTAKASFAVPVAIDNLREPKVTKRKHSDGLYYNTIGELPLAPSPTTPKLVLDRSPNTALILLVMALGKICECRDDLPGPVPDGSKDHSNTAIHPYSPMAGRTDSPPPTYPMRHSPSSSSHSTGNTSAPSPLGIGRFGGFSSPRSSVGEPPAGTRNVDVIPGLAYYAQASDILGNLTGFHDLVNAQCCLLAGLYAGQLANTLESLTWIQAASRICRLLVKKPSFKSVKDPNSDRIKLAFWTSLQLESDILAELDIPPSGIQEVQDVVPYPKATITQGPYMPGETQPPEIIVYYAAQLYVRKLLNDIQKELYQEKDPTFKRATRSTSLRNAFVAMITDWKTNLPENLQWRDSDPAANNINDARLRGKYYGAMYIIHRPFLHAALDYDFETPQMQSMQSPPNKNFSNSPATGSDMGPPRMNPDFEMRREQTVELARLCIEAAMSSTVAFDGVLDHRRLVVTNIMGTAHAQFGNMLVLSAAFKSKTLGSYVKPSKLDQLFTRTIKLLKRLAPISQTLERDAFILQCLRKVVFEGGEPELATSFSSE
ncbi:hypothetical protein ACLMJK_008113 [Lecanora helva]